MTILTQLVISPPFSIMEIDLVWDADWDDAFRIIENDGSAVDLTDMTLEWYARPNFQHSTLLVKLNTGGSVGQRIVIDSAPEGFAYFNLSRANVQTLFIPGDWEQFLLLKEDTTYDEIWRGPLRVHPGRTT